MIQRFWVRNGWSAAHLYWAVALVAVGALLTWEAWADILFLAWKDEEASHVLLVPVIVAWLVHVRRERLRFCKPEGRWIGPVLVAAGWMLSSWGYHNSAQSLWHGGAVVIVVGCFLTAVGKDVLLKFLPAFAVLAFLVPMPLTLREWIAHPLQRVLTRMTSESLYLAGYDVEYFGNAITINGQQLQVAEACNGLRMVFTLVLVCIAVAFGTPLKGYARFLIVALSVPAALVANFIRMVPTVWIFGHASGDMAMRFHDAAGWIMLFVAFLLLVGTIRVLRWAMLPVHRYTLAYD